MKNACYVKGQLCLSAKSVTALQTSACWLVLVMYAKLRKYSDLAGALG